MLPPWEIDRLVEQVGERYDRLQDYLIAEIARKVKKGLDIGASIQWDFQKFLELGGAWQPDVEAYVMKTTGLAEKDVKRLFRDAGYESIRNDNKFLPADHQISPRYSPVQLRIIKAAIRNVDGAIRNMANVTVDSTLELFGALVSEGFTMLSSGSVSLDQAVAKVGRELVRRGVSGTVYPSGRHDKVEVAVRRALRTSLNQTMLQLGEQNAVEAGTDLVEVTAHAGARPEHALWQGGIYSLHGKTKGYKTLKAATGYGSITGLGGVNCRHNFFPYYPGASEKAYTADQLRILKDETVTVDGVPTPLYDAEQKMRAFEREMREYKRLERYAGEDTKAKQSAVKRKIKALSEETGITIENARTRIYGRGF